VEVALLTDKSLMGNEVWVQLEDVRKAGLISRVYCQSQPHSQE
jgi:hypothetical protein